VKAFLLTRQWRDGPGGITLDLWFAGESGPVFVEIPNQEAVFFIRETDIPILKKIANKNRGANKSPGTKLLRTGDAKFLNFHKETVVPCYFKSQRSARKFEQALLGFDVGVWEADIRPPQRFLMERFITGGVDIQSELKQERNFFYGKSCLLKADEYRPQLKIVSLDIETTMDAKTLLSVAVYSDGLALVFMVEGVSSQQGGLTIIACENEKQCLQKLIAWFDDYDPDIIIGWNVVQFDFWVLETLCQRYKIPSNFGRNKQKVHWREDDNNRRYMQVPGRVILDGIEVLKAATYTLNSYSLENVARTLLGDGKLLQGNNRGELISELFAEDKVKLAQYNIKDCELVWDIFSQESLIHFVLERSQLTGLLMDRIGGSVAAFDYLYLPKLHRKGYVAPNLGEFESELMSPGGYVLDSDPGIYRNVLVLDFKSLYPSIIRTFKIDPYGFRLTEDESLPAEDIVEGYRGAAFSKHEHILPTIIETLWQARDRAKQDKNAPLSQAIKIIMNSFYGVLGSTGCRFYDPRVCSSITLRGHDIIQTSKQWIENQGYKVIYGDTDSLFVWIGEKHSEQEANEIGENIAKSMNTFWQKKLREEFDIACALEMEYETHYLQFLMPTIRGSTQGSKKRYAGIVNNKGKQKLIFKGLENVRTDWTPLAKQFQEELYRRVFAEEALEEFILTTVEQVMSGARDHELVYRKRLRRKLGDYQKNVPPHVQAARKLQKDTGMTIKRGDWIEYIITLAGPEPVDIQTHSLDYQHYIDKQMAPVADGVLQFVGLSFENIAAPQLTLFER